MTSHEPLPAHLDRIGRQLTAAAHELHASELRPRRRGDHDAGWLPSQTRARRGHPTVRRGAVAGVVALAAAAVLVLHRPAGESAWAKETIQRAAAVLIPPSSANTILHVAATQTLSPLAQRAPATAVATVSEEAWIQQGSPWGERAIEHVPGGPVLERSSSGDIYNQTTDTLYPAPQIPTGTPHYTLTPTGHAGSYRLSVTLPHGGTFTQTLDAGTVHALRDGTDEVQWSVSWNGHTQQIEPLVGPSRQQLRQTQVQQPNPGSSSFAPELHGLLDSGHARVTRTTVSDGQPAIEIASVNPQSGPRTNYYVNPQTYAPIELDIFGSDSPGDVTRVRYTIYETLPLAGHEPLLHVTVPPTAHVDHTPADYWNANLPVPF
jgi:hypothetical protein